MVLHRDEARPAVPLGHLEQTGELPGIHARGAEVARLARTHDVVERFEGLLNRGVRVEPMDLVEVDVVGAEPTERGVDGVEEMLAGQPAVVRTVTHGEEGLGRDDDLRPGAEVAHGATENLLADSVGVHVGGVEEVDARLNGALDERASRRLVEDPGAPRGRAIRHDAETETGDAKTGAAEGDVVHGGDSTAPRTRTRAGPDLPQTGGRVGKQQLEERAVGAVRGVEAGGPLVTLERGHRVGPRRLARGLELDAGDRPGVGDGAVVNDLGVGKIPDCKILAERAAPDDAEMAEEGIDRGTLVAGVVTEVEVTSVRISGSGPSVLTVRWCSSGSWRCRTTNGRSPSRRK